MNSHEQSQLIKIADRLLVEVRGMRQEQRETNQQLGEANRRLDRLEQQITQNTAAVGELRVSVVKLTDKLKEFVDYGRRIQRLEDKVFIG